MFFRVLRGIWEFLMKFYKEEGEMHKPFKTIEHTCDFCVVGGGLSGTIAALSAARK